MIDIRAIFSWGSVNHCLKTFSRVAQIFTKQSNTKEDHRPTYGVKIILHLNSQRILLYINLSYRSRYK